ncbi:hypothetical protein Dsin_008987 [Dipteronia sinensis]|uniref:Reverse transcriptase zinc-binding domain-containing protein n=1 Tax=Dipteronia sinensis TaxID=43782 RepID=A0AAE0EBN5_9ROSI|nr:hypothetical protein Dsin_008987 [Dipteronia sinensis]
MAVTTCVLCNSHLESHAYLFFECLFSRAIWTQLMNICGSPWNGLCWNAFIDWASTHWRGNSPTIVANKLCPGVAVYHIWRERNFSIFEGTQKTSSVVARSIIDTIRCRLSSFNLKNHPIIAFNWNMIAGLRNYQIKKKSLNEERWKEFHKFLAGGNIHHTSRTLNLSHRYMQGQYLVDVVAQHPQDKKVWLVQNGFVKTLEMHRSHDMVGLPHIIINSNNNLTMNADIYLRINFYSCPSKWVPYTISQVRILPPYHYICFIQDGDATTICIPNIGEPILDS